MNKKIKYTALSLALTLPSIASAERLNYAIGFTTGSFVDAGKVFAEEVKKYSEGDLDIRVFPLSLLNFAEMSDGVGQGMADFGTVLTPYFPESYPNTNMVADLSMTLMLKEGVSHEQSTVAYAGAMAEYVMLNCDDCQVEYKNENQVFTSSIMTTPYTLLCREKVASLDDISGKKVRVAAAPWARWVESLGGSPIVMSANESYEALSQGVVDCDIQAAAQLSSLKLSDIVTDVTVNIPGGLFSGGGSANMNLSKWNKQSSANKKAIMTASAGLVASQAFEGIEYAKKALDSAKNNGIALHEADPDLTNRTQVFVRKDLEGIVNEYAQKYSVQDAQKKAAAFIEILNEWEILAPDLDSRESFKDALLDRVYSKVNVNTYGS
ncbi:C4-dicarboxylate TRAP transporter substrate-binding protein [Marinobacter sp. 1-3A]|uniref:C4-dicarboxylate TRAP transporter substrate-binding protein n=1 Tax=Marinobacter sp. 1-3A TaxID=2582920 RepID=UPI00190447CD|nr:C4-dicarboxylate TRAP transporter substrate-binding protein [Marinobacter sp. 1-3A]MBK1875129.1 C4-dicarboxylate TRAP transporter substrate-binding protein [Marinobacter sp. 1-3A]